MAQATQSKPRRRLPRRWPLIRLSDALISLTPRPRKQSDVVILRMFGIGDALLFRMVLEKYAEALNVPLSQITVLGTTAWRAAAEVFFTDVDVRFIDERHFAKNFFYRLRMMRQLRRRGFHVAICGMRFRYPHVIESLMAASGSKLRIVVEPRSNEKFDAMFAHYAKRMTNNVPLPEPEKPRDQNGTPLPLKHEIEQQLEFLSAVAGRPITLDTLPPLNFAPGPAPLMDADEKYAVLNIGASHEPRRWPLEYFFEIARRLFKEGYSILFLGGPSELELRRKIAHFNITLAAPLEGVAQAGEGETKPRIIVAINLLDLLGVARLVQQAALVVSNDSGIGHMAIMLRRPSVLMVGGGHFGSFMPYPDRLVPKQVRFLYRLMPCYHCNWGCTMMPPDGQTFPCVKDIAVADVWQAIADVTRPPQGASENAP